MQMHRTLSAALVIGLTLGWTKAAPGQDAVFAPGSQKPAFFFAGPNDNDPLRLLMRPDVQTGIRLDIRQKNALAELQGTRKPLRIEARFEDRDGSTSPQQREESIRNQVESQMAAYYDDLDARIRAVLRPEQLKRFHQIHLQWRGLTALADSKVAREVDLSPEHHTEISRIVADYQLKRSAIYREAMETVQEGPGVMRFRMPDLENENLPAKRKLDALKREASEKILAILSDEERVRWTKAQGEPFTFVQYAPKNKGQVQGVIKQQTAP